MELEQTFHSLLGLDARWEVLGAEYETQNERFLIVVAETQKLWPEEKCPEEDCGSSGITCHDHAPVRSWRHMDAFGKRTEILCEVPRGRCPRCRKVYRVKVPWQGEGKHFTKGFEAFALTLIREMPVKRASEILGECDTRIWRMLLAHVDNAYRNVEWSDLVSLGVDEMSIRKGHEYLSIFCDLQERKVVFATEGKGSETFEAFVGEMDAHNGHPKSITQVAIDMSPAYQKGVRENLGNAKVVFDKFHVVALVSKAADEVRRKEARMGTNQARESLKGSMWVLRSNPENLTERQQEKLESMDLENLASGVAYQMKLNLQQVYQSRNHETAGRNLDRWIRWVRRREESFNGLLRPMGKAAKSLEKHREGILAYWTSKLTTGFLEGLNSVFSAVKRKARGYRSTHYMKAMLYFVAGKLRIPTLITH